jgi:hypothetical protein
MVFGNGVLFRHESADVNGRCLHYLIGGDGECPVLLLHGFSSTRFDWKMWLDPWVRAGLMPIVLDYDVFQIVVQVLDPHQIEDGGFGATPIPAWGGAAPQGIPLSVKQPGSIGQRLN